MVSFLRSLGMVAVVLSLALVGPAALLAQDDVPPPWRRALPRGYERATIQVGGHDLEVELARTGGEQSLGLGYRDGLEPDTGMLFVYDEAEEHSFWMMGMRFCLDIVWIEDGLIVGATERICPAPPGDPEAEIPRTRAPEPVRFVLEVPAGYLAARDLGPGTEVVIPEEVTAVSDEG